MGGLGQQAQEFKKMAPAMHEAGIEVIEVVDNQIAQGNDLYLIIGSAASTTPRNDRLRRRTAWYDTDYTRTDAERGQPAPRQADHGQLRHGDRDARRRLRFRPRGDARRQFYDVDRAVEFFELSSRTGWSCR